MANPLTDRSALHGPDPVLAVLAASFLVWTMAPTAATPSLPFRRALETHLAIVKSFEPQASTAHAEERRFSRFTKP